MYVLETLLYGGIALLVVLLIVYEFKDRGSQGFSNNEGYPYYTPAKTYVRIRHMFASRYRVYVYDDTCPVETRNDRYGTYFILRARSASEAERLIDEMYQGR